MSPRKGFSNSDMIDLEELGKNKLGDTWFYSFVQ